MKSLFTKVSKFEKKHFSHKPKCKGNLVAIPQLVVWDKDDCHIRKLIFCTKCFRWEFYTPEKDVK